MKPRVYLETTIVSYLTARPSRDLILAAHQEVTREWWHGQREQFGLYVSQFVLDEAGDGDATAAAERLKLLKGLPLLPLTDEVRDVATGLLDAGVLPPKAQADGVHIAVATVHEMDVLLTWNCRHLANGVILGNVGRHLRSRGYEVPIICTPEELMGE
ncbi:MAG: type II toxin-antitoxin system VapC family toxin [Planctomycetes bacterium]|nr:type II toxin-antitoxin system VapC family toxin [Planctomycetota bacterium]